MPAKRSFASEKREKTMQFQKPFHVENGVILDAQNREVRLWGVNYYAPFHHNYVNLKEAGADCRRAIDRDIADFLKMGVGLVRMHLIDREISDMDGNVVENEHLELLDYLIDALDRAGIALMLTPVAWWNTTENQKMMEEHYAYWYIGKSPAFGFSNFYAKQYFVRHNIRGSIVVISSNNDRAHFANASAYGAVKAALTKTAEHAAVELAAYGIRVNVIAPGWTDTGEARMGKMEDTYYKIPLKRWCKTDEIGKAAVFLSSEAAASITGCRLVMDGGALLLSDKGEKYGL